MNQKRSIYKTFSRLLVAFSLIGVLVVSSADTALAARTGGRISGGSFRRSVPSRSYRSAPSRGSRGYSGGYSRGAYPRGGGFGFPFLIPFFGFGGGFGSLFSVLIVIAIANFLISSFRNIAGGEGGSLNLGNSYDQNSANPAVAINKIQVGLLAEARGLKADLDRIAQTGNTGSSSGLAKVLQETNLTLLRHPEYWVYASATSEQTRLVSAEAKFNHLALTERSKFQSETLSNVKQQIQDTNGTLTKTDDTLTQAPGEYIVVTLVVAAQGKLNLPDIKSDQDLRQALNQVGSISGDQLLALEVLWTPQAESDTLSSDDLVAAYPHLKMI